MISWLTSNAGLKIASLLLATLIWLFVNGITSDRRTIGNVPLEIRVKPGSTLLQSSAKMVDVTLRGTRDDVRQIARADLSAIVDLTREDHTGLWEIRLGTKSIRHPSRVQVVHIEPARVTVRVGPEAAGAEKKP